ncbi:hypothetical protein C2S52_017228 [Perilla frutescens var. hirtella]|nr:hypothetical protein C2S52_017228 [Perilla frutescens var. hirtella]KAH6811029.1 hypothetical protein C2S51_024791 [Perilla frutescens var. frutescens]
MSRKHIAANLRAVRGDAKGAARAQALARNLEFGLGLGFYKDAWSVVWDYMKNYAWNDAMSFRDLSGVVYDLNELLGILRDLSWVRSDAERVAWAGSLPSSGAFTSIGFHITVVRCAADGVIVEPWQFE